MDIDSIRQSFPVLRKWNYLNHSSVSPLPTPVKLAMTSFFEERETDGGLRYAEWLEEAETSKNTIGRLINSPGRQISFFGSTSHALNSVANMLSLRQGDEVVVTDLEFPSNAFPWVKLAKKGVSVSWARSQNGILGIRDIEKAVSNRTRVIAASDVCYYNGVRLPLSEIAEFAQGRGITLVVDAMQSIGALQIDVRRLGVDFLASNSYKWLLGPFGVASLYCRDDWITKLESNDVGWYSVEDIWSREVEEYTPANTARRFETGHPNFAGVRGLKAAVELLLSAGLDDIEKRVLALTSRLREGLRRLERVEISSPEPVVSGITVFTVQGRDTKDTVDALRKNGIVVFTQRWKGGMGVKVSPHFYNTESEVDRFVDVVASLA